MVEIWSCWTRKYIARPSYLGFIGTVFSPQVASTRTFENVFPKLRDNSDKAILTERDLIVHNFGILLMNSNCFAIFFSSILVMSVQISICVTVCNIYFTSVYFQLNFAFIKFNDFTKFVWVLCNRRTTSFYNSSCKSLLRQLHNGILFFYLWSTLSSSWYIIKTNFFSIAICVLPEKLPYCDRVTYNFFRLQRLWVT